MGNCVINKISTVATSTPSEGTQFSYTGGVQTYTVPFTGWYQLEVWGAASGGAKGGYSIGYKNLNQNTILYVVCGQSGVRNTNTWAYNGGGALSNNCGIATSGGGCTHIATANGVLSSLSGNRGAVLIVAGGAGGNGQSYAGGSGGGTSGGGGTGGHAGGGASQSGGGSGGSGNNSRGGSFGVGGQPASNCGGGGGGGWYGGGSGAGDNSYDYDGSGGGGSGYIGGVDNYGSYTKSTSSGQWSGSGKAQITPMFSLKKYRRFLIAS